MMKVLLVVLLLVVAEAHGVELTFRPKPPAQYGGSSLIWYVASNQSSIKYWVDEMDKFIEIYRNPVAPMNLYQCSFENPPPKGKVCSVDIRPLGPCISENYYGFHRSTPCIFLKLNDINNWYPDMYNDTTNLPEEMPDDLKGHIKDSSMSNQLYTNVIWVSCEGETPADKEHIGPIQYIPQRSFPGYYFPDRNIEGYMPPLVAILFERPQRGIIINIECKAWAKNIHPDHSVSVHFELMID